MRFASVCSGIEAASLAWLPLGWECAWLSEIDPFVCAVLAHHYPDTPNHGDMTEITDEQIEAGGPIDVLVGGTPCQSFSVAGLRGGLDDDRGNLALEFLCLAARTRAEWVVWENVPGVLSSNGGRDFGALLGGLAELGYGFAYRVLDAQFFGVAQRRRRVFLVGCAGGQWQRAAAVLVERQGLSGHPPPRREAGSRVADGVANCLRARSNLAHREDFDTLIPTVANCLTARTSKGVNSDLNEGQTLIAFDRQSGGDVRLNISDEHTSALTRCQVPAVAYQCHGSNVGPMGTLRAGNGNETGGVPFLAAHETGPGWWNESPIAGCLRAEGENRPSRPSNVLAGEWGVRRLTPRECERLQGFPDDHTLVPYTHGKPAKDGPRYKAIGNSIAVPVLRWIGERLERVEATR